MKSTILLAALLLAEPADAQLRPLFDAISEVESGGNRHAVGDGGRSLGPYQIQRAYWQDAGVPGRYEQVRDPRYAERVMLAYWKRYCSDALVGRDHETLARVHNGGVNGARKPQTRAYWRKVQRQMARTG